MTSEDSQKSDNQLYLAVTSLSPLLVALRSFPKRLRASSASLPADRQVFTLTAAEGMSRERRSPAFGTREAAERGSQLFFGRALPLENSQELPLLSRPFLSSFSLLIPPEIPSDRRFSSRYRLLSPSPTSSSSLSAEKLQLDSALSHMAFDMTHSPTYSAATRAPGYVRAEIAVKSQTPRGPASR